MSWISADSQLPPLHTPVFWKWVDITNLNRAVYAEMFYSGEFKDYYVSDGAGSYIDPQNTKDCYWYLDDPEETDTFTQ